MSNDRDIEHWGWLAIVLAVLVLYAACSVNQAVVWRDELSLWSAAVQRAPDKPRPHLQLALALMERRRYLEAQTVLDDTDWILHHRTDLPVWDRAEATAALHQNRLVLARLANAGPGR